MLDEDDRDSEDPDETLNDEKGLTAQKSSQMDEEEEQYDPRLEQKIQRIKSNFHTSGDMTKDNTSLSNAAGMRSHHQQQTSKGTSSLGHVDVEAESKNMSRLEEVLKRQRERLESLSGAFQHQAQNDLAESSFTGASPIGRSDIKASSGVYSTSTNNLEKAYEDLEREIIEIKQRLQASAAPNNYYPNERLGASLTQTRQR